MSLLNCEEYMIDNLIYAIPWQYKDANKIGITGRNLSAWAAASCCIVGQPAPAASYLSATSSVKGKWFSQKPLTKNNIENITQSAQILI